MSWITILLIGSVVLNVLLIWYIKKILEKLLFVSDNMSELVGKVKDYNGHLAIVTELETYYGDDTLMNLLKHTKAFSAWLETYEEVYSLSDLIPEDEYEDEDEYDSSAEEEESPT